MEVRKEVNERIKQIRRELGLTQQEFAERIGLKQNSIALIESGKRNISDQAVLSICREYGINEEWLRTGWGEKRTSNSNSELEALTEKYNLSVADVILIEKYIGLKPGVREAVLKFMTDVVASLQEPDYSDIPDSPEELEQKFPPLKDENKEVGLG